MFYHVSFAWNTEIFFEINGFSIDLNETNLFWGRRWSLQLFTFNTVQGFSLISRHQFVYFPDQYDWIELMQRNYLFYKFDRKESITIYWPDFSVYKMKGISFLHIFVQ